MGRALAKPIALVSWWRPHDGGSPQLRSGRMHLRHRELGATEAIVADIGKRWVSRGLNLSYELEHLVAATGLLVISIQTICRRDPRRIPDGAN